MGTGGKELNFARLPAATPRKSSVVLTQEVGVTWQVQNSHISVGASTELLEQSQWMDEPLSLG